ncbi:MAG TPA: thioester domain-containing protein [Solirubrobacteraceae bacterium]|nr:thioester domain-containing protein [Solirubrobacteraceae bacterium]
MLTPTRAQKVAAATAALAALAAPSFASAATQDPNERSDTTARLAPQGPRPLEDVVVLDGKRYAAGLRWYRVGGQVSVPAYSLSLHAAPDPAARLINSDPGSTGIANLRQATALAACWASNQAERPVHRVDAAATQVAIWHFTDYLRVKPATVPNPTIRARAAKLIAEVERLPASGPQKACGQELSPQGFSKASFSPTLAIRQSDPSLEDQAVRVVMSSGSYVAEFENSQVVQIRVDGVASFVCSGTNSRIRADQDVKRGPPAPRGAPDDGQPRGRSCGEEVTGTSEQYTVDDVKPLADVEGPEPDETAQLGQQIEIRIPRDAGPQHVEAIWSSGWDPAAVFVPGDRGAPIITASRFNAVLSDSVDLDPSDLNRFQTFIQQTFVAFLASLKAFGLIPLFIVLVILVTAPQWGGWVGRKTIAEPASAWRQRRRERRDEQRAATREAERENDADEDEASG